jgi:tetratricopeptide (TPR) repeat protein
VAFDRTATLQNAEKLLRQGKLESAIAEYVRVVDQQPRDWGTANLLGDLYVRAGQTDKAIEQFARIADSLSEEGVLPRASALYKKILKLRPEHEHALLQAAEIAASQGLLADARFYLMSIIERLRSRGDSRRAAQMRIRLGTIDVADFEARTAAAHARVELGDIVGAVRDLRDLAAELVEKGRSDDGLELLRQAATLAPEDADIRAQLARAFVARGDLTSAAEYMTIDTAGDDPQFLLTAAEIQLRFGHLDDAIAIARRLLECHPDRRQELATLGWSLAEPSPDVAFAVTELVVDLNVAEQDWTAAAAVLQEFAARSPHHVPALMRLVEICLDGGLEAMMYATQARLADAYIAAGRGAEARVIAEDLLAREPWEWANCDRFRRALELTGEPDPDAIIAERLSGPMPFASEFADAVVASNSEVEPGSILDSPPPPAPAAPAPVAGAGDPQLIDDELDLEKMLRELEAPMPPSHAHGIEIDLTGVLDEIVHEDPPLPDGDIEETFAHLREETARQSATNAAEEQFARVDALRRDGDIDGAIAALQSASRAPALRFASASMLGRLYRERGMTPEAIEWYERAAQAPAPTPEEGHALLFDLADALESDGEVARALAVCLELQADAGTYRDVDDRVHRLTIVQARG